MSERRIYVDGAGEAADDAGEGADALASSPTLCCNLIVGPSKSTIETRPESSPTALARSLARSTRYAGAPGTVAVSMNSADRAHT